MDIDGNPKDLQIGNQPTSVHPTASECRESQVCCSDKLKEIKKEISYWSIKSSANVKAKVNCMVEVKERDNSLVAQISV